LESNFQLNTSTITANNLLNSDLCFLIGINTRYESSYLNIKLRKRYNKNNFNIISLSSLLDLTFPIFILGSTTKILNIISTGNSLINQKIKNANYPILIFNFNTQKLLWCHLFVFSLIIIIIIIYFLYNKNILRKCEF